jgi:RNA polymerase sigma-70 factor (ECF subfamily)
MSMTELIQACLREDRTAQRDLFNRYSKLLMGIAVRYVSDQPAAQDVVQESFIRIYKSLVSLQNNDAKTLEAWMKKITARESIRWLKKNKRYTLEEPTDQHFTTHAVSANRLQEEYLLSLLAKLPGGYRTTFNLYVIEGYSHKEIGELLNITESTSRSQLTRAKKMLQHWIKNQMEYELQ